MQVVAKLSPGHRITTQGRTWTVLGAQKIRTAYWYILRDEAGNRSSIRRESFLAGQRDGSVLVEGVRP
jgi:hypothetical protein